MQPSRHLETLLRRCREPRYRLGVRASGEPRARVRGGVRPNWHVGHSVLEEPGAPRGRAAAPRRESKRGRRLVRKREGAMAETDKVAGSLRRAPRKGARLAPPREDQVRGPLSGGHLRAHLAEFAPIHPPEDRLAPPHA